MFEKILSITKNFAIVKVSNNISDDILNYNVILEDSNKKVLGEIAEIVNGEAKISFLGAILISNWQTGSSEIEVPSWLCAPIIVSLSKSISQEAKEQK